MNELQLNEIKKIGLDTLTYINHLCKEHNLRYFLCCGTLLGAVRHKGFIPWDDDIDIAMPRPDYDKLLQLLNHDPKYLALSPSDKDYYYTFAKIIDRDTTLIELGCKPIAHMGVYVDIFPLDGMPDNEQERDKHFKQLHKVRTQINQHYVPWPKIRKNLLAYFRTAFICIRNKMVSLQKQQAKYRKLIEKYAYDDSKYVYTTGSAYLKKDIFLKEYFSNGVDVTFESGTFRAPANYDAYLRQLYGNYMQLPPEEKRVTNHSFLAYYKTER